MQIVQTSTVAIATGADEKGLWGDADEIDRSRIVHGLRTSDTALLDELIAKYKSSLMKYLLLLTRKQNLAEDVFQETWIRVIRNGHQYIGSAQFQTWLFRIARNATFDLLRRRDCIRLEATDSENQFSVLSSYASSLRSPFEEFEISEGRYFVLTILSRLSPRYREVLFLRFYADLTLPEIADAIRAPLSTVKSRLYRGLRQIGAHLGARHTELVTLSADRLEKNATTDCPMTKSKIVTVWY